MTMYNMSNLGTEIRSIRHKRNLTLRNLASMSGVHIGDIQRIESDKHIPTFALLKRIIAPLGVREVRIDVQTQEFALVE